MKIRIDCEKNRAAEAKSLKELIKIALKEKKVNQYEFVSVKVSETGTIYLLQLEAKILDIDTMQYQYIFKLLNEEK